MGGVPIYRKRIAALIRAGRLMAVPFGKRSVRLYLPGEAPAAATLPFIIPRENAEQ